MRPAALSILVLCTLCPIPTGAAEVVLNKDSRIEIQRSGPAEAELEAASDLLKKYLLRSMGRGDLRGNSGKVTFSLYAKAVMWYELPREELSSLEGIDEFTIKVQADPEPTVQIHGATVLATGYGAMHFLEHYLGITWLFPGELGLALPTEKEFRLPEKEETVRPALVSRVYTGLKLPSPEYMLPFRKKFRQSKLRADRYFFEAYDFHKALKLHFLTHASHNIVNIYPVREYAEEHPDLYPLKDGERYIPPFRKDSAGRHQAWHACYTNPKVTEIAIERARKCFERGGHCFSLGINDGMRVQCECAKCKDVGWPESYYQYVNQVAEAVKEHYPPHLIGVLAYGDVRDIREDLKLADNVLVLVTGARLAKWSRHAKHLGTYEYFYGAGFWVPNFPLKGMVRNARYYREHGAKVYHAEAHPIWALDAPKVYLQSRLLWDPELDVDTTLTRYCRAAFGDGGPAMKRFYLRWASKRDYIVDDGSDAATPMADMGIWRNSKAQFSAVSADDYAYAYACIEEAKKLVKGEKQTKRLEMVEVFFGYSKTLFELSQHTQPTFDEDAPDPKKALLALVRLWTTRERLLAEMKKHEEWFCGASPTLEEILSTRYEGWASWTINNEANSAIKTALFRLREQKALDDETKEALPTSLKPYLAAWRRTAMTRFGSTPPKGIYYGHHPERFAQMQFGTERGAWRCEAAAGNPQVLAGRGKGQYKPQWADATFSRKPYDGRTLFLVKLEARGKKGAFRFSVRNLGHGMGWLGVGTGGVFGDDTSAVKKEFLVEPLFPNSGYEYAPTTHGVRVMWTPKADDASFGSACTIEQIDFQRDKSERTLPELPDLNMTDDEEGQEEE